MSDLNQVTLTGRLGRDPENRAAGAGTIWKFSVGVAESKKDGNEWVNETKWIEVEAWGDKRTGAPPCEARKGSAVFVSGKLDPQSWEDRVTKEKKYKTVVKASVIRTLEQPSRGDNRERAHHPEQGRPGNADRRTASGPQGSNGPPAGWDDIPDF